MKQEHKSIAIVVLLLGIITILHYSTLSGNWPVHEFYRRLYYLPIILAAFHFKLKGGFFTSVIVVFLYAPHMLFYFGEINIEVINQFLELIMFMVVGLITGFLVERDFRKRILLENQLIQMANLENYTHNILDSLDSGVIAFNQELQVQSMNQKAKMLFGDPKEIKGILENENFSYEFNQIKAEDKKDFQREILYHNQLNQQLNLRIQGYPLKNYIGELEGVVLLIQDMSKVKQLEQQLKRSERLSAIGQLASGIAHEIRNPLGIIKTISQTIVQGVKDHELQEALEIIQQEIERANRVIKGLLDYAKPHRIEKNKLSINELVKELMVLMKSYGEQHGVVLEVSLEDEWQIEGDKDKLKQAFINLMMNGIQAMNSGGKLQIRLMQKTENMILLSFKDEGIGISEDIIDKVFNPFFTTKDEGTGLGLSITHRIIEEHGGNLEIISQPGIGTEVIIQFPLPRKEGEI